jgi:transposase InsO family protein
MELFDYIEVFYNQRRRHSTLGQISPHVATETMP